MQQALQREAPEKSSLRESGRECRKTAEQNMVANPSVNIKFQPVQFFLDIHVTFTCFVLVLPVENIINFLCNIKHSQGIFDKLCTNFFKVLASYLCNFFDHFNHIRGFVTPSSVRDWGNKRAVGLRENTLKRC